MNCKQHNIRKLVSATVAALFVFARLSPAAETNVTPVVRAESAHTNNPPMPPLLPSPVESFRRMLAMATEEQKKFLSVRPPEIRQRILEKLAEYQSLSPKERELKLRGTELRWYLLPLMNAPATNRQTQLEDIPPTLRDVVASRIQQWDQLPMPMQKTLLTNSQAVAYFTRPEADAPKPPMPPSPADSLRRKLNDSLKRFVDLPPGEKEKTLRSLPDADDRRQMEQTLQAFEKLKPAQRERCIRSFAAFASMTEAEREEFLKSAERWSRMSPSEREAWRELVSRAPIMPNPLVPRPPGLPAPAPTNGGG